MTRLAFGGFVADRTGYRVLRGGAALDLTPKLLDLLFFFLDHPAQLVTREQLLDAVWPDANVTDNALAQAISDLREALGDSASAPTYILTVARRGYRFIAPVEVTPDPRPSHGGGPTTTAAAPETGAASANHTPVSADHTPVRPTHPTPATHTPVPADHTPVRPAYSTPLRPAETTSAGPPSIAVLDFDNVTDADAVEWLAAGIAETVTSDLATLGCFHVIDRWRVVQAARRAGGIREIAAAVGATLAVAGSYQLSGTRLRITARVVDLTRDETIADAKVDGPAGDIFALQDGIVPALARALRLPGAPRRERSSTRETSNLDAYRAYTEGWLKIESLDTDCVPGAIADFERAIALDGRYALAYAGLATAELAAYEMTRLLPQPNLRALAAGIEHARHAIRLDAGLADAHAILSFLLVSAREIAEARDAARRAVELEPDNWRHHYRLGHALWGGERIDALERALAIYPDFAYALLEMAMVHVARGDVDRAEAIARDGIAVQDRQTRTGNRFPAVGFHWLLGALLAARDEHDAAAAEFDLELAAYDRRRLYGPEYAAAAWTGRGHADLARGRPRDAIAAFERALELIPGLGRASLGLVIACDRLGDRAAAAAARQAVGKRVAELRRTQRTSEALLLDACVAGAGGDAAAAARPLSELLHLDPPSFVGWTMPIEPFLMTVRNDDRVARLLARLADRAR